MGLGITVGMIIITEAKTSNYPWIIDDIKVVHELVPNGKFSCVHGLKNTHSIENYILKKKEKKVL